MFEKYPYTNLHELNLDWIIGKVKEIEEGYDGIVSRMGALELAMDNLEGDVATLQSSYTALSASVNAHSLAIEYLGNSVTALRTDVDTLLDDVNTLTATTAGHTTQINDLSTRMNNAEGSITSLTGTANTHTSQIAALTSRVNAIEITITSYGNRISALESAVNILNMRTAANETDIATLEEILYTSGENVIVFTSLPQTVNGITFALDADGKTILAQGTALSTGTGDASIALASPISTAGKYKITCAMTGNVGTSMRYVSTTNTSRTIIGSAIYVDDMQPSAGDLTYLTVSYGTAGVQVDCSFKPEIMELSAPESVPAIVITDETYEGFKPIIVRNAIGGEITALSSDVNAIQNLHGYDYPWVGGAGKNLLPMTVEIVKANNTSGAWSGNAYTLYGVTFTVLTDVDGNVTGINVNGTASTECNFNVSTDIIANLPYDSYAVNGCPSGGGNDSYRLRGSSGLFGDIGSGTTFTLPRSGISSSIVQIVIASGYTASNLVFYPMIRLATEADATFAPYTNICPISGRLNCHIETDGDIYTSEFSTPCYGGVLDVKNGVLTVTHGIIDMGLLSWSYVSDSQIFYATVSNIKKSSSAQVLCSGYKTTTNTVLTMPDYTVRGYESTFSSSQRVYVKDTRYTDATAFRNAVNGLKIVYEFEITTEESVSPQVIELVRGYNRITSDTGNMDATIQTFIGVPKPPTTDGTYVLTATVTDGMYTLTWESNT